MQSVRGYKQNMHEMEERRKKSLSDMVVRAKLGPKDLAMQAELQKQREMADREQND